MAYTYVNDPMPTSKYSQKCPYTMVPEFFVVHNSANKASAKNEVAYINNNAGSGSTSWHFAIDDIEVRQSVPLNRNGYHAGDGSSGPGNRKGIGIEICYSAVLNSKGGYDDVTWRAQYESKYRAAEANTVEFIAQELLARGWGTDKVKKHQDFAKKDCPHRILNEGRWNSFVQRIGNRLNELKKGDGLDVGQYEELLGMIRGQAVELEELKAKTKMYKALGDVPEGEFRDAVARRKFSDYNDVNVLHETAREWVLEDRKRCFTLDDVKTKYSYAYDTFKALSDQKFISDPNSINFGEDTIRMTVISCRTLQACNVLDKDLRPVKGQEGIAKAALTSMVTGTAADLSVPPMAEVAVAANSPLAKFIQHGGVGSGANAINAGVKGTGNRTTI